MKRQIELVFNKRTELEYRTWCMRFWLAITPSWLKKWPYNV